MWFSARPVTTRGSASDREASTASATLATETASRSTVSAAGSKSSTEKPAAPASASSRTVSATPPGASGKQRSLSTFSGTVVAPATAATWATSSSRVTC